MITLPQVVVTVTPPPIPQAVVHLAPIEVVVGGPRQGPRGPGGGGNVNGVLSDDGNFLHLTINGVTYQTPANPVP